MPQGLQFKAYQPQETTDIPFQWPQPTLSQATPLRWPQPASSQIPATSTSEGFKRPVAHGLSRENKTLAFRIAVEEGSRFGRCPDKTFWKEVTVRFKNLTGITHNTLGRLCNTAAQEYLANGPPESGEQDAEDSYTQAIQAWAEVWQARKDREAARKRAAGEKEKETAESQAWRDRQTMRFAERREDSEQELEMSIERDPFKEVSLEGIDELEHILSQDTLESTASSQAPASRSSNASISSSFSPSQPRNSRKRYRREPVEDVDKRFLQLFEEFVDSNRQRSQRTPIDEAIEDRLESRLQTIETNMSRLTQGVEELLATFRTVSRS